MKPLYWLCGPRLKNSDSTFNKNIYKNKDKCKLYYSKFFGVAINVNKIVFLSKNDECVCGCNCSSEKIQEVKNSRFVHEQYMYNQTEKILDFCKGLIN